MKHELVLDGVVVTCDFGDIKRFHFPKKIDKKIVRQLIDALFPPMENILKDFELMSFLERDFYQSEVCLENIFLMD